MLAFWAGHRASERMKSGKCFLRFLKISVRDCGHRKSGVYFLSMFLLKSRD
jgi:hypothetical protein